MYSEIFEVLRDKFQFHKGTIRTHERLEYFRHYKYFNSIKVQLEPVNP